MRREKDGKVNRKEDTPDSFMLEMLAEAMRLIRAALKEGRPKGIAWEARRIYEGADDPSHKSLAAQAALLSDWPSFAQYLAGAGQDTEVLNKEQVAGLFIHHTFNRWRRKIRRDKQMERQVARANVSREDGEILPWDPVDPDARKESLKNLREEIAIILGKRSERDRLVLEMKYFGGLNYVTIVQEVRKVLPEESISESTISRIVDRFEDELLERSKED